MKKSYKMRKTVERLIKRYGFQNEEITYGVEPLKVNRRGDDFYDWAELFCPATRLHFIVAFDGKIYK